jgi:S1-C subfamily serine protease
MQTPESSGEDGRQEGWAPPGGNGSWSPPPPPPGWSAGGWHEPGAPGPAPAPPPGPGGPYAGGPYAGGPYGYWPGHGGGWGPVGPGGPPSGPGRGWYGWAPSRPRRSLPSTVTALLLAVAVLVGLGIGHGVWSANRGGSLITPQNPSSGSSGGLGFNPFAGGTGTGGGTSGSLTGPAAAAADDLVDIDTTLSYENGAAAGTGIVLTSGGYILTNNHVISGATSIKATDIGNGRSYTATVVGYDRTHDVAVIRLQDASGLKVASFGDSSRASDGESVVGLGNAGGVGGTPSSAAGQITALGTSITAQDESNNTSEKLTGLIQTSCNIQPGDSGGALIDSSGRVIGMDTAASTGFSFSTAGNQGFAIPINQALAISRSIRAGQASNTVHIGATAFLGVEVDTSPSASATPGAVISKAISGGAAAAAGITQGDVITSLGGSPVSSPAALTNLIGRYHPGDQVPVVWSDPTGAVHRATVTLATGPAA